jgi:multicomponent Na+:H+ antiporter subunit E
MIGKSILLFLVWLGLTSSLDSQELIVGIGVSLFIAKYFTADSSECILKVLPKYFRFIPVFLKGLIQSNIDVAKIVLDPKLPTNTGIIKLKTSLKSDHDKLLLANAITLTPGTITLDLEGEDVYIHVLDLKTLDKVQLQTEIIDDWERYIIPTHTE